MAEKVDLYKDIQKQTKSKKFNSVEKSKSEILKKVTKQKLAQKVLKKLPGGKKDLTPKTPQKKTPNRIKYLSKLFQKHYPNYSSFNHSDGEKGLKKLIDLSPKGFFLNAKKLNKKAPKLFKKLFNYALEKLRARDLFNTSFFHKLEKILKQERKTATLKRLKDKREFIRRTLQQVLVKATKKQLEFLKRIKLVFKKTLRNPKVSQLKKKQIITLLPKLTEARIKREIVTSLLKDSSLNRLHKIDPSWLDKLLPPNKTPKYKKAEFITRITRNLYSQRQKITKQSVINEYLDIIASQKKHGETTVYQNRNILYLANNEIRPNGKSRFRLPAVIEAIRKQGGVLPEKWILMAKNNKQDLEKKKKDFLKLLAFTKGPLTVHIEAHGSPYGIHLSGGQIVNGKIKKTKYDTTISNKEISNALIQRKTQYPQEKPPIFIYVSCFNHNIMREVYRRSKNKIFPPIATGTSEYNQFAISDFKSKYGSSFNKNVLNFSKHTKTNPLRIKHIIQNQNLGDTNTTIYVPTFQGKVKHIVKKGKTQRKKQLRLPGKPPSDETVNV